MSFTTQLNPLGSTNPSKHISHTHHTHTQSNNLNSLNIEQ